MHSAVLFLQYHARLHESLSISSICVTTPGRKDVGMASVSLLAPRTSLHTCRVPYKGYKGGSSLTLSQISPAV